MQLQMVLIIIRYYLYFLSVRLRWPPKLPNQFSLHINYYTSIINKWSLVLLSREMNTHNFNKAIIKLVIVVPHTLMLTFSTQSNVDLVTLQILYKSHRLAVKLCYVSYARIYHKWLIDQISNKRVVCARFT